MQHASFETPSEPTNKTVDKYMHGRDKGKEKKDKKKYNQPLICVGQSLGGLEPLRPLHSIGDT